MDSNVRCRVQACLSDNRKCCDLNLQITKDFIPGYKSTVKYLVKKSPFIIYPYYILGKLNDKMFQKLMKSNQLKQYSVNRNCEKLLQPYLNTLCLFASKFQGIIAHQLKIDSYDMTMAECIAKHIAFIISIHPEYKATINKLGLTWKNCLGGGSFNFHLTYQDRQWISSSRITKNQVRSFLLILYLEDKTIDVSKADDLE